MPLPSSPDRPDASEPPAKPAHNWVPIRSLAPRHRARIAAHLVALAPADRYLRFGYQATDAQIESYVDALDFARDEVFGIFNRRLELIAMAHLAHLAHAAAIPGASAVASEFGVSVLPRYRGRGFGADLFARAMLHARNRGIETLFIHALSRNQAMLKIVRRAGATVLRDGSESDAWLKLPPDSLRSHVDELVSQKIAEFDYGLKRQMHRASDLLEDAKDTVGDAERSVDE